MPRSTRLKALLVPLVAAGAALLLSGCLQISPPQTTTAPDTDPTSDVDTDESEAPTDEGDTVDVFSIAIGDCLLDPGVNDTVTETTVVDCASEHSFEVFGESTVADGDYPGDAAISDQAESDCTAAAFESFVGLPYEESQYFVQFFVPTEGSWEQGDRQILCLIADPSGSNTGTLEGANS